MSDNSEALKIEDARKDLSNVALEDETESEIRGLNPLFESFDKDYFKNPKLQTFCFWFTSLDDALEASSDFQHSLFPYVVACVIQHVQDSRVQLDVVQPKFEELNPPFPAAFARDLQAFLTLSLEKFQGSDKYCANFLVPFEFREAYPNLSLDDEHVLSVHGFENRTSAVEWFHHNENQHTGQSKAIAGWSGIGIEEWKKCVELPQGIRKDPSKETLLSDMILAMMKFPKSPLQSAFLCVLHLKEESVSLSTSSAAAPSQEFRQVAFTFAIKDDADAFMGENGLKDLSLVKNAILCGGDPLEVHLILPYHDVSEFAVIINKLTILHSMRNKKYFLVFLSVRVDWKPLAYTLKLVLEERSVA